jgi:Co/Zn/Cd efflux system component
MPLNNNTLQLKMSAHCHDDRCHDAPAHASPRYRKVLWAALVINALMFGVELWASFQSGSVSLLADAIDFFGDTANYAVSLAVLSMALAWRSRAAIFKAVCMLIFGIGVLGKTLWAARSGVPPEALTMGVVGFVALVANVSVAAMLYAYREGDANMRSVWLCTRNDAIGNVAVMLAALGVFGTHSVWPDLAVAALMGTLAMTSAFSVLRHARSEMRATAAIAS